MIPIIGSAPPIISTRNREVWTYESKRLLDRMATMLHSASVKLLLECNSPVCPAPAIQLVADDTVPLGRVFRCGCTDRSVMPKGAK